MDVKDIKTFIAVAEELHFGRAAERLHMAQPPVSRTIRALEEELGVALFVRDTRNVRLTNAGQQFIQPARDILESFRRATRIARAADRGETGLVRMAYAGASTQVMVGLLAHESRAKLPGIVLELHSQNFADPAMSRVLNGEVDIALGRWDSIPTGISTRQLAREDLVLAVPASHPLASRTSATIRDFSAEQFIRLTAHPGSVLGDRFRRICHSAGFEPDVVQVAPDTWTAISLVAAGVGCTLTVSTVAMNINDPGVRFIRMTDSYLPVELKMAWIARPDNEAVEAVLRLSETILPSPAG
jgi:DNA-binding transcriptional LysR family regulator